MFCTRLANGVLFPTGDPIVPFVISPRFECLNKRTHTCVNTFNQGPLIVLPLCGHSFFQRCPHWFCTQNNTGDSTPTEDCCPSIVNVPGLNAYIQTHTHTQSCVRCILRTSYCSPLLFPLLLDLNFCRHLPLDLYTFFNRGHLLIITANRRPIVPLCYKSSVYPLDTLTHTHKLVNTGKRGPPIVPLLFIHVL